jgi:hypothetical protein
VRQPARNDGSPSVHAEAPRGGSPCLVPSGYPALGDSVLLFGPTSDAALLERFLHEQRGQRAWGVDCRLAAPHGAGAGSGGYEDFASFAASAFAGAKPPPGAAVLTLATCGAALMWDVATGGVPPRLGAFLEDGSVRKCRVSAEGLAQRVARSMNIAVSGLLELRHLYIAAQPADPEVRHTALLDRSCGCGHWHHA